MRIAEVKRTPALFCAVFFILTAALMTSGCAATDTAQKTAEEQITPQTAPVAQETPVAAEAEVKAETKELADLGEEAPAEEAKEPEAADAEKPVVVSPLGFKDSDPILKFKDEVLSYGEIKKIWAYSTGNDDPGKFETLTEKEQDSNIKQIAVNHLSARKARDKKLTDDNYYKAREYEIITRYMPTVYAEKVIGPEVNPTDAEIIAASPPSLPEVVVRVYVAREMEDAKKVYDRIKGGEDMETIIRKESKGLSASLGGTTKWLTVQNSEKFPPPVVQKFLDTPKGELLEPFFQDIGYLVVKVEDKHSAEEVQKAWIEANRESYIFDRRKERFNERVKELLDRRKDVEFKDTVIKDFLEGKTTTKETVVKIRGIEFSLESVVPELMRMSASHGRDKIANHLAKFIERAVVTEEAYSLGLDLTPETKERVKILGERHLAQLLKTTVADEAANAAVTDDDIRAYYEKNQEDFMEPLRWCMSFNELDSEAKADELQKKLQDGADFAELAKASSVGSAREAGGYIGCYPKEEIPPVIFTAVSPLLKGQILPEPLNLTLADGQIRWLLIKMDDVLNPSVVPFDRVKKPIVEGRIKTQRRGNALGGLVNSLVDEYGYENCFINRRKEKVSQ